MKAVIKFVMAIKKLTYTSEIETEELVKEQRREIEGRVNGASQTY